jgi:hypothetical protein
VSRISVNNKPKTLPNFTDAVDTGNASFAGDNDAGSACIAGVVDTGDATLESLTVRQ